MRFPGSRFFAGTNERFVTQPVYGPDPIGSAMVASLDSMHSLTYGYQSNNPVPAWKPQGERERKSSYDLGPLQRFEGAAMVQRAVLRQFRLQKLGSAQPQQQSEVESLIQSALEYRIGAPGDVTRFPILRYPTRAG